MAGVAIKNFTRRPAPRLPFAKAAALTLPGWDLSLVFAGATRAKHLNTRLRGKTYVPNVLSYKVGVRSGEIIICPAVAAKQARKYDLPPTSYYLLLFIHGCLHLKGMAHSATMERSERTLVAKLLPNGRKALGVSRTNPNVPSHRNRNRHRHLPGQTGGRRRSR